MLIRLVVGSPSLVFTRLHESGQTRIRAHQGGQQLCKRVLGYDANVLYLSTMLKDITCWKGEVVHFANPAGDAAESTWKVLAKEWFNYAKVDIEISEPLWGKFEEMCPFFLNKEVPQKAVPPHVQEYLRRTGRHRGDRQKLVGALAVEKMLVYEPLLQWYLAHSAAIKAVH